MSIFKKITLLFLISFSLMLVISHQMNQLNTQRVEALITQKYLQDAKKIFVWLATNPAEILRTKYEGLSLSIVTLKDLKDLKTVTTQAHTFGSFSVVKTAEQKYLLKIVYMDEVLLLSDDQLQETLQEDTLFNLLIVLDIALLVGMFLIIIKMLSPLKNIMQAMQTFSKGSYSSRAEVRTFDEIGAVGASFNQMAENIQNLISSRTELLRDIGHELRTPISKGLFAVDALKPSSSKEIIHKAFSELERLTAELLEIEKLEAMQCLNMERFQAETLILESLSRLMIEDESQISVEIREDFMIEGDLHYLSLALKNLIDNALKYTDAYPIEVRADARKISVINEGLPLHEDFTHYLQAFTRDDNARQSKGYGLGLNIVSKILHKHKLRLEYEYKAKKHHFSLFFG